jgi:hypothetical protein
VDRLVEQMSSFLLGGRAWTVARVIHPDRVVIVTEAPGGSKPSWGGLKYGFEVAKGWKVVADNVQLRIDGDGIGHESVRQAIAKMASSPFWDAAETRQAVLARLPGYRLTKFQDCLPEAFALEVIENYLLDVSGTLR